MIIEIALGIVLGVIILRLLPIILTLGLVLSAVLVVLGVAGFLIHWALGNEGFLGILAIAITFAAGAYIAHHIEKRSPLNKDEAGALTIFMVAGGFTAFAIYSELASDKDAGSSSSFLPLAVFLSVFGAYLIFKITTRLRKQQEQPNDQ
jgi:peptidoglycan/LPS O-acetylase OafA/YrhL